ncbi:hypothetical protein RI367_007096 [Sorochytrium milnesiophthora]
MDDDADFANVAPFSAWQTALLVVAALMFGTSTICNGFLSYVLLRNRHTIQSTNLRLTTFLNLADTVGPACSCVMQMFKLYHGSYAALGKAGCQVDAVLISFGVMWAELAVVIIATERYCVIVCGTPWRKSFWRWPVLAAFLAGVLLPLLPVVNSSGPPQNVIQPSGIYCLDDIQGQSDKASSTRMLYLIVHPSLIAAVSFMYIRIYSTVRDSMRMMSKHLPFDQYPASPSPAPPPPPLRSSMPGLATSSNKSAAVPEDACGVEQISLGSSAALSSPSSTSSPVTPPTSPRRYSGRLRTELAEQRAFKTSLAITVCLYTMLVPYVVVLILATAGMDIPAWLDVLTILCGMINLVSDAAIVYSFDPRAHKLVNEELTRLRHWVTSRSPCTA